MMQIITLLWITVAGILFGSLILIDHRIVAGEEIKINNTPYTCTKVTQ